MKSQTQTAGAGRRTVSIGLLGICAAAALAAALWHSGWMAAGAAAQSEPTVTVEYGGLGKDAERSIKNQLYRNKLFSITQRAPDSVGGAASLECRVSRCRYMIVSWSGINASTISLTRNHTPTPLDIGVPLYRFQRTPVPTQLTLPRRSRTSPQYVPLPWAGEELTVTVSGGGASASAVVKIPAPELPRAFNSRAAADQVGVTLVENPEDADLPMVLAVWRKTSGADTYEVQYTFRTRSRPGFTRAVRLTRFGSDVSDFSGPGGYESYNANWDDHPNPAMSELQNSDFARDGAWFGRLLTLPELLAGADGWPEDEAAAKAEILAALRAGKSAIGVRVRALAACADTLWSINPHCYRRLLEGGGALALRGMPNIISYVKFKGANAEEWLSSAGGG